MAERHPVLFIGHGNPMHAITENEWAVAWRSLGERLILPRAIVCISAHWYVPATAVTSNASPRTIHDFGGFPQELFEVEYPAPGDPGLAGRLCELLSDLADCLETEEWGLDHGAWSVLRHLWPEADVPVVQLSIDRRRSANDHYEIGRALAPLRDEGILILGSGNVVHNLHAATWGEGGAYPWATAFEERVKEMVMAGDHASLISYSELGRDADLSIPTPEHYLPLLYVLGASTPDDEIDFPAAGIDLGSVSMLSVLLS